MNNMRYLVPATLALSFTAFGAGCTSQPPKPNVPPTKPSTIKATVPTTSPHNALNVQNQTSGKAAMIKSVFMEKQGFVVIHEDNGGMLGNIVGSSNLLNAGETKSVSITMNLHAGLSHWAALHLDNGDGVFDAKQDPPVKDENGEIIMKIFKGEARQ
jgi:hypothetical protein